MVDIAKLDAVLDYIGMHPEEWYQSLWGTRTACGTAFCVAGHLAVMEGAKLTWTPFKEFDDAGNLVDSERLHMADGRIIFSYARDKLDLSAGQASELFDGANSLGTLKRMRDALALDPDIEWEALDGIAHEEGDR